MLVYVSPGDMTNLDLLIYIRRIWSWPMPYGGGRCGRCGSPKTMLLKDHLLPNTGLLTRSARKLNTVSIVIPRVGDERGLLNCGGNIQDLWSVKIGVWKGYQLGKLICLSPPDQRLALLVVLDGNDLNSVLGSWFQTSNSSLCDTRVGPRDHFSGRGPRLLILDDVTSNPGTGWLP